MSQISGFSPCSTGTSWATIVPYDGFAPWRDRADELALELAALDERFVHPPIPTADQKEAVHNRISDLLREPPPAWLRPDLLVAANRETVLWAGKLSPATVTLLAASGWMLMAPDKHLWRDRARGRQRRSRSNCRRVRPADPPADHDRRGGISRLLQHAPCGAPSAGRVGAGPQTNAPVRAAGDPRPRRSCICADHPEPARPQAVE
jgi:hypothetical protein